MDFWRKFKFHAQASLKRQRLEREASFAEVKHFCECLEAFLMDGYSWEIPQQAIKCQVQLHVNTFWWQTLIERGIEKMELAAVMTEITQLGSESNPLHARRLDGFAVRRGRDEHSGFLHKVEMCLYNADFKSMTRYQLAVHLFLRDADASMAKNTTEFLQLDPKDQSMVDFRTALRQTENYPWYGAQKHGARYTESGNTQAGQR